MALLGADTVFFDIGATLVRNGPVWVPGAPGLLCRLKDDGFRLGLISNTGGLSRAELAEHLAADFGFQLFDGQLILLSGEVGIEKPDIRIFLLAANRAAISPWKCVFVGENLEETVAAQNAGMKTLRFVDQADRIERLRALLE